MGKLIKNNKKGVTTLWGPSAVSVPTATSSLPTGGTAKTWMNVRMTCTTAGTYEEYIAISPLFYVLRHD